MAGDGNHEVDPDALARADAALAALNDDYLRWVAADVAALGAAVAELRACGPGRRDDAAARVFEIAHDIKGQGTTFDYPLMTRLGQVMCDLLRAWELDGGDGDGLLPARLEALAAAMAEVVAARLSGDGGVRGRDLVCRLKVQCPGL